MQWTSTFMYSKHKTNIKYADNVVFILVYLEQNKFASGRLRETKHFFEFIGNLLN